MKKQERERSERQRRSPERMIKAEGAKKSHGEKPAMIHFNIYRFVGVCRLFQQQLFWLRGDGRARQRGAKGGGEIEVPRVWKDKRSPRGSHPSEILFHN
jgi:hypothetical protein